MFKLIAVCLVVLLSTPVLADDIEEMEDQPKEKPIEKVIPTEKDFPDAYQSHKPVHCEKLKLSMEKFHGNPKEILVATFVSAFSGYPGMIYYEPSSNTLTVMDFMPTMVQQTPESEPVLVGQAACYTTLGVDVNWQNGLQVRKKSRL